MNKETVDILVATYNTDVIFLEKQIYSILSQTYKDLKILISDDNSTNKETIKFLDDLTKTDKRIVLYKQSENLGYLKNFEFLLKQSTSKYIAYSDHDDIWYENKIEILMDRLIKEDTDLVYSDCRYIDKNDNVLSNSYLKYKNLPFIKEKNSVISFSRHIAIGCSQLFTRNVLETVLPFKESVIAHDWITMYIASKLKGISCIDEPLFGYRVHESNVFGGKNVVENKMRIWKREHGKSYKEFLKYRNSIIEVYSNGASMCYEYSDKFKKYNLSLEKEIMQYYNNIANTKILNLSINKYIKYLSFNGIGKRAIKEVLFFHFPILSYLIYLK